MNIIPLPTPRPTPRMNPRLSPAEQLGDLLLAYGLPNGTPVAEESGAVDIAALIELLPEELGEQYDTPGPNPARRVLTQYLEAVPPRRRYRGPVEVPADTLLGILVDRLEFFEGLSRSVVRVCKGVSCVHFSVCPYTEVVQDVDEADKYPCMVERDLVKRYVEDFVTPDAGRKAKIDPRRPEAALLFKQLIDLLVRQLRISMYMQISDSLIDNYEILKDGDMERFDTMNQMEHPLMAAWDRVTMQIQRVMKDLGLTPEFQIRQDLYVDDEQAVNAQVRAVELVQNYLEESYRRLLTEMPEDDPMRGVLTKAIEQSRTKAREEAARLRAADEGASG